jgi:hypothetical protein
MRAKIKILTFLFLFLFFCSKAYIKQGVLDPNFDQTRTYKVAILPFLVRGEEPSSTLRDRAYTRLQVRLQQTGKFMIIDRFTVERVVRTYEFGATGKVDPSLARKIARELGAELVVLSELSLNPVDGGLRILANVQILDVNKDYVIYTGQGRTDNPISKEAGAEYAIDLATDVLIKRMR